MRQARWPRPILVTGMPRSGTTWLARLLASAPGSAMTGREPMNTRGRQFALGGTIDGWSRLVEPSTRQQWMLRTSYLGVHPLVFGRYGHRQWAAPAPWVRKIVKDPFAMLSMPAITEITGARSVLIFRPAGAGLVSYRRMGWRADVDEIRPVVAGFLDQHGLVPGVLPAPPEGCDEVARFGWFWNALYGMALHDAARLGDDVVVIAHQDIAQGGEAFGSALFSHLGLQWGRHAAAELGREDSARPPRDPATLHNFDRAPASVAQEWETKITPPERDRLELDTQELFNQLRETAFRPGGAT
ncbi:MAG: sulfotransferase [Actinomycetia bacterium]|nr:sulfotransferase [Actinomycetes bacterium]